MKTLTSELTVIVISKYRYRLFNCLLPVANELFPGQPAAVCSLAPFSYSLDTFLLKAAPVTI